MSTAWQLQDFENQLLLAIREMDALNFGGVPNFGTTFNKALLDQEINQAVADLVMLSGFQPRLTDRFVSLPTTTAVDFALPTDLVALTRVEYQQAPSINTVVTSGAIAPGTQTVVYNAADLSASAVIEVGTTLVIDTAASGVQEYVQVTAVATNVSNDFTATFVNAHAANCIVQSGPLTPYRLDQLTPDEFDAIAGTGFYPTSVIQLGLPTAFREPIGTGPSAATGPEVLCVRFYPQIGSQQVANGDTVNLNYTSYGLQMAAATDYCSIPVGFQRGVIHAASINLWRVKGDDDQADRAEKRMLQWTNEMRKYRWNLPQAGTFGFIDENENVLDPYDTLQW